MQKTAEAMGTLSGNKIAGKITKVSRTSPQNTLETITNEVENIGLDREYLKKDIDLQKRDRKLFMI